MSAWSHQAVAVPRIQAQRPQSGFSLIELLVAMGLGLAMLTALTTVYFAVKDAYRFQGNTSRLQEDAGFALSFMAQEMRMAGYAGCNGLRVDTGNNADADDDFTYPANLITAEKNNAINSANPLSQVVKDNAQITAQPLSGVGYVRGFDDKPPKEMFAVEPTEASDSVWFSYASSNGVSLTADMVNANDALVIGNDEHKWSDNFDNNDKTSTFLISDCNSSHLFLGKLAKQGANFTITHDANLGNTSSNFPGKRDSTGIVPNYLYRANDTMIMPLVWSMYYVNRRDGAKTPALYRVTYSGNNRGNAEEIAANVEYMRIHYGENTENGGAGPTMVANEWRTSAADVTDWGRVVAVRIGLMMVSEDRIADSGVTQNTPTLLGESYTLPEGADAQLVRKEFSTTVVLRNRVAFR